MFKLKPIVRSVALACSSVAGAVILASPANAQDQKLERVEITGSAIKRIEGETALPVSVISRQDIEKMGVTSAVELLDKLSVNNGGGYALGNALGDAARPGFSGASLRGLGPNSTLILLNGRRLAVYAFDGGAVNLQQIPFAAIERVEVLRDGASAIYGSDAVAGVINFITRKDYTGIEAKAGYLKPKETGGTIKDFSLSGGFGDLGADRFNVFAVASIKKEDSIKAKDREFSKSALRRDISQDPDASGTGSSFFNRLSSNAFPANILTAGGFVNPYSPAARGAVPGVTTDPMKGVFPSAGCLPPVSYDTTSSGTRCRYDYASQIDIIPQNEVISLLSRGVFQINSDTQAFVEASYARQKSTFAISQTPASEATTRTQPDGTHLPLLYPAGGKYYPGAGIVPAIPGVALAGDLNLYYRTLELGPRADQALTKEYRLLGGLQGLVAGWDYNAATYYTVSDATDKYLGGLVLESKLLPAMATGNINPFGFNDAQGLALLHSAEVTGDLRKAKLSRWVVDATVSKEVAKLPAGPLSVAIGAQFSKDKYNDNPSPILSTGDIIGGSGEQPPVAGNRNVRSLFTEANIPLVKTLDAQLAARWDHYSDFGNAFNPKASLRWQPSSEFLLRGSVGKGFRAPTIPDLVAPKARTNAGGAYNDPLYEAQVGPCNDANGDATAFFDPKYCTAQLSVTNQGNPNLQPEKTNQWSVGMLFEPTRNVSLGLDFWWIRQKNLIGIIGGDTILADYISNFDPATLTSSGNYAQYVSTSVVNGIRVINTALNQTLNVANQATNGIDFDAKFAMPTEAIGKWTIELAGTYIAKQSSRNLSTPNADWTRTEGTWGLWGPVQRWKSRLSTTWDVASWSTTLGYNLQSAYDDQYPNADGSRKIVGAYDTFDLVVVYRGIKNLTVNVGARNLFDRQPPKTNQGQYFQVGYEPTYVDPRGFSPFITVAYKFK